MTAGITLVVVALLGALLGEWLGDRFKQHMPLLLSFGGAFLLGLCFLHLLPEAFAMNVGAGHWVIGGFLLQIGLEYLSKGMEHGHVHVHGNRFGLLAFLSLCLHALIEAMPFGRGLKRVLNSVGNARDKNFVVANERVDALVEPHGSVVAVGQLGSDFVH